MTPTISATGLSRRYRDQTALDDVSFTVEPGTVTGLLGRNGAGKTTLMRIITGQEFPTSRGDADAQLDRLRALLHHAAGTGPDRRAGRA